ncbi:hypothetical protein AAP_03844 [Ascosphaera apis ARSEF 7405]|uniref:Conserved oligomeric Golgi complex subunit 5 n=1 Tax=Ascosphaera apis ARSEF 7405 TaxID=392613 RepID=A0A167XPE1_9EURO|nr:hypothetical protein AAP_03844 [Ascosphaera apis ARSEF 7405]
MTTESDPSYIDYKAFLDPDFSPYSFANTLVTTTNNPSDTPLDLATPLSRVLFDVQEVDTHIHTLTTKSAIPLLSHTESQVTSAQRILDSVESQVQALTEGYKRLEQDVIKKHEDAEQVRIAAENSLETLRLAKAVGRCLILGRQLMGQVAAFNNRSIMASGAAGSGGLPGAREDYRALVGAAYTLIQLRQLLNPSDEKDEGYGLAQINVVRTLRTDLINPTENTVKSRAQQIVNRFSLSSLSQDDAGNYYSPSPELATTTSSSSSSSSSFAHAEGVKARVTAAISALYLLSPTPNATIPADEFQPDLLLQTLRGYIHNAISGASSVLSRALSIPPQIDRALHEVSMRCQNVVALETLLEGIKPPNHPGLSYTLTTTTTTTTTSSTDPSKRTATPILSSLYQALDTTSLVTHFWRSLASSLNPQVQNIVSHGGAAARSLKSARQKLREDIRLCVVRGSQVPRAGVVGADRREQSDGVGAGAGQSNWEREAMVMVNAVVGPLGR